MSTMEDNQSISCGMQYIQFNYSDLNGPLLRYAHPVITAKQASTITNCTDLVYAKFPECQEIIWP